MKQIQKYFLSLFLINIILDGTGYLLVSNIKTGFTFIDIALLAFLFSIIALITVSIFLKGQTKDAESQTLYSLVAIGLKFLLELLLALLWFIVAKKSSLPYVLMFFVLYLTLTLFSVRIILKALKNRSL